jgi:hypothetical protein
MFLSCSVIIIFIMIIIIIIIIGLCAVLLLNPFVSNTKFSVLCRSRRFINCNLARSYLRWFYKDPAPVAVLSALGSNEIRVVDLVLSSEVNFSIKPGARRSTVDAIDPTSRFRLVKSATVTPVEELVTEEDEREARRAARAFAFCSGDNIPVARLWPNVEIESSQFPGNVPV